MDEVEPVNLVVWSSVALIAIGLWKVWRSRSQKGIPVRPLDLALPNGVQVRSRVHAAHESDPSIVTSLRQNLRLKVMHDEDKVERLIDMERERAPNASHRELLEAAIERWERDNR